VRVGHDRARGEDAIATDVGVLALGLRPRNLVDVRGHDGFGNDLGAVAGGVRHHVRHKAPSGIRGQLQPGWTIGCTSRKSGGLLLERRQELAVGNRVRLDDDLRLARAEWAHEDERDEDAGAHCRCPDGERQVIAGQ
jgi:hypothetical protein